MEVLSQSEIDFFEAQGYLHCNEVFSNEDALSMRTEIWQELELEFGIKQSKPETWRIPPQSPKKAKFNSLNQKVINKKFRGIINNLLGKDNWKEPNSWGGFLVTFPTKDKKHRAFLQFEISSD